MTLTIKTEEDEQRQLKVTVEVPEERVQAQMKRTARELSRQISIPGFRKGKVPYNVLLRRVGEEALRADAVEEMIESLVAEVLDELEETPYRQPTLDELNLEPLVLNMTIPLEPVVSIGDYRAIRREIQQVEVTEEALAEAVERIRANHQVLEPVDRPAAIGDMITISGEGKIDEDEGEIIWQENNYDVVIDPDRLFPGLPFVENVESMSAGEEKEFSFIFPEDYQEEELVGKGANFKVTLEAVQSRELPELTDELAQEEGEYETAEELMKALDSELLQQAERQAKSDLVDEVVDEILVDAEIVYPPVLVEDELDQVLERSKEQITRSGWQWDDYLTLEGESEESLREQWREGATERISRGLVLQEFIKEEQLQVSAADIDASIEKRLDQFGENEELREQLRSIFTQGQGLEMLNSEILMEKVQERVVEIVSGNAPDLETLAVEEADEEE